MKNNINNSNGSFNLGIQKIKNQNINFYNSSNNTDCSIYNLSKVILTDMKDINKMNITRKIFEIASFISSIVTILTFIFTFTTDESLKTLMIFILALVITLILWIFWLKYHCFFKNLDKKGFAYSETKKKLYLKNEKNKIYEVKPPKCPYCKNRKSNMYCCLEEDDIQIVSSTNIEKMLLSQIQNKQRLPILFICENNSEHTIKIDWTQFEIPKE